MSHVDPDGDQEITESVDQVLPEDQVDISKVGKLDDLSKVANANTTQMRLLQRKLYKAREDPQSEYLIEPLEAAIAQRSIRQIKLVRQRTALQEKENERKRTVIEEALRPTVGALNNDRRQLLEQVVDMAERVKKLRDQFTDNTAEQRRIAAKLKQWESFLLAMVQGLDRLSPLPTNID